MKSSDLTSTWRLLKDPYGREHRFTRFLKEFVSKEPEPPLSRHAVSVPDAELLKGAARLRFREASYPVLFRL
jgi:hypothetical protein